MVDEQDPESAGLPEKLSEDPLFKGIAERLETSTSVRATQEIESLFRLLREFPHTDNSMVNELSRDAALFLRMEASSKPFNSARKYNTDYQGYTSDDFRELYRILNGVEFQDKRH